MGFRFRIANWIMGDYLRNYLAVGVRLPLINLLTSKLYNFDNHTRQEIERIIQTVDELFEI